MKTRILAIATLALLAAACSKVTKENYDQLKAGMTSADVEKILGKPTGCDETMGVKHCTWGDEKHSIKVNFIADKAAIFSAENIR